MSFPIYLAWAVVERSHIPAKLYGLQSLHYYMFIIIVRDISRIYLDCSFLSNYDNSPRMYKNEWRRVYGSKSLPDFPEEDGEVNKEIKFTRVLSIVTNKSLIAIMVSMIK